MPVAVYPRSAKKAVQAPEPHPSSTAVQKDSTGTSPLSTTLLSTLLATPLSQGGGGADGSAERCQKPRHRAWFAAEAAIVDELAIVRRAVPEPRQELGDDGLAHEHLGVRGHRQVHARHLRVVMMMMMR